MRDKIHEHLRQQPAGATPEQLFALVFAGSSTEPGLAETIVRTLLEEDRRFRWDAASHTWRCVAPQASQPAAEASFVVLDLETTDHGSGASAIIEIGAVRVSRGRIVAQFEQLLNPGVRLSPFVTRLTGIDDALLAEQPTLAEVWPRFREFIGDDDILVAHNGAFDFACLNTASQALTGRALSNRQLCTFRLARQVLPQIPRRGLDALAAHFGIPAADRHRALGDARITTEILLHLLEDLVSRGVSAVDEILELQNHATDGRPFVCRLPRDKVELLPSLPGIYRFFDEKGELLYVGRARNLRERVGSYLSNSADHSDKTLELIRQTTDVRVEIHGSELEAAPEEAAAIRAEKPPFNRLAKHLPRIAFVRLDLDNEYPRLSVTSRLRPGSGSSLTIGPFRKRRDAERAVTALTRLYRLRTCPGNLQPDPAFSPCVQAELQACTAPCAARIPSDQYRVEAEACARALAPSNPSGEAELMRRAQETTRGLNGESTSRLHSDLLVLRRMLGSRRSLTWLTERPSFVVLTGSVHGEWVVAYAVCKGELVLRTRLNHEEAVDAFADTIESHLRGERNSEGDGIDGLTILAAWMRDRPPDDGVIFPLEGPAIHEDLRRDWRATCASMLGLTRRG